MKQKTKLWEYLIVSNPDIDKISELGSNGWELISVVYFPPSPPHPTIPISYIAMTNYYFKRQLR